jgi:hypothetical protein
MVNSCELIGKAEYMKLYRDVAKTDVIIIGLD